MIRIQGQHRMRRDYNYTRAQGPSRVVTVTGTSPGSYVNNAPEARMSGYIGHANQAFDVVTANHRALIAQGEIINNPFSSIKQTLDCGGIPPTVQYTGAPPSPWTPGMFFRGVNNKSLLHANADFLLPPFIDADGNAYIPEVRADLSYMRTKAKTAALAKVDQSVASSLSALAELHDTILMARRPLASLQQWTSRFSIKRLGRQWQVRWPHHVIVVREGPALWTALANQYLAWYYGARPLLKDIEEVLEAYVRSEANRERQTARSGDTETRKVTFTTRGDRVGQWSTNFDYTQTYTETVTFRTGILFEPPSASLRGGLGLRLSDVPSAVWDVIPWSFAIDYVTNVAKLISALSPRPDVRYLACWDTTTYDLQWESRCTAAFIQGPVTVSSGGTEWATRRLEATLRSPSHAYESVGLILRMGDWSDTTKILAVISLLIQQLSGLASRHTPS